MRGASLGVRMGRENRLDPIYVSHRWLGRVTVVYPVSPEQRESESFPSEVPSRQWLMSQISMVTFDQRSAYSLISRLIINGEKHIGSPLILAGENADLGERKEDKEKGRAQGPPGGSGREGSPALSASCFF